MDLAGRVLATVRAHQMVPAGGRVLVAVSGGADSVTLLHLLLAIQDAAPLTVCGVVHLNHQLRPSADTDEAFCRALSARTGLPFVAERHDVAALARGWGTSVEAAGRRARYSWFTRAAAALGADVVATGHTRDDQAETYLLQLIRGAGPRGLAGIQPAGAALCRPLLDVRRAEVRDWVAERGVQFIEDPSNADLSFRRNRVRAELLPLLERRFSAGIVSVLARSAAIARRDADYLEAQARLAATRLVEVEGCGGEMSPLPDRTGAVAEGAGLASPPREVRIDAAGLTALPAALASRVVRFALGVLGGEHFVGADHVDRLLALAGRTSGGLSVPGQQARVRGGHLVLRRPGARAFANSFRVLLSRACSRGR